MKKLRQRFSRSKPAPPRNAFVERDTDYVSVFERGLALDRTPELGRRERFWVLIQLYKSTFGLPGETIEAGCLFGLSSFLMCHASRLEAPSFTGKGHSIVDSFRGFDEPHEADFGPKSHRMIHGVKNRPRPVVEGWRKRTERTLAEFPDLAVHEGWIPEVFETLPETRYRFVHVDVDLHDPTRDCLEYFYPRLVESGVLVIDDYGFPSWPGCKVAADAFAAEHGVPIVPLPTGNAFLIKRSPA